MPTVYCQLLNVYCHLLTVYCYLLTIYSRLPTIYCQLLTVYVLTSSTHHMHVTNFLTKCALSSVFLSLRMCMLKDSKSNNIVSIHKYIRVNNAMYLRNCPTTACMSAHFLCFCNQEIELKSKYVAHI